MYTEFFNQLYGTIDGLPAIAIGAISADSILFRFLCIDDDGKTVWVEANQFVVDVRFRDNHWVDVTPGVERVEE